MNTSLATASRSSLWLAATLLCVPGAQARSTQAQSPQDQNTQQQATPAADSQSADPPSVSDQAPDAAPATRFAQDPAAPASSGLADSSRGAAAQPVASLIGASPIYLREVRNRLFRYSFAASSGYDSAVNDVPHLSGPLTLGEGYAGLLLRNRRFNLMLQHDAQFSRSFDTGLGLQQYQRTSASFAGFKSRRTDWSFLLENGYGADAARAVGSLSTSVLNAVPVPDQNAVAFGLTNGNILSDHALFGMQHRISPTRTADFSVGSYFHHFFSTGTTESTSNTEASSNQQYSLNAGLRQRWSTRQLIGLQGELVQENYTQLHCTTGSVGVYGSTQFSRAIRFEGTIGPVFGTAYCSGNYEYNASLAAQTGRNGLLYIGTARQRNNGLVRQATWENSVFGGFLIGNPRRLQARADAGYASYVLANPSPSMPSLDGYFLSGELQRRLSNSAELSLRGRYFSRATGNGLSTAPNTSTPGASQLNRAIVLLTYTWSPEDRGARLRDVARPAPAPESGKPATPGEEPVHGRR